jgi:gluconolactonase
MSQAEQSRRQLLRSGAGAFAAGVAASAAPAAAQVAAAPVQRDWARGEPVGYPDPDIAALDPAFNRYLIFNTPIRRLHTGTLWAEGPAWNGVGRYLVWSDIPNNVQMRWTEENGTVSVFRNPSGYSNGSTFDFQGRQLSCEHGGRRVVRYEYDGSTTVVAERFDGKRLNSPNDVVVHPDGGIWFTDPPFGIGGDYEGFKAEPELKPAVYRIDPRDGAIAKITDEFPLPNGLCFSPDYKRLYIAVTGGAVHVMDVVGNSARNARVFVQLVVPGTQRSVAADGIRCDRDGNLWCAAGQGVQVVNPQGATIGMIRLPEICGNLCFGGSKRNRLFMIASQSLYSVFVGVKGAHIC